MDPATTRRPPPTPLDIEEFVHARLGTVDHLRALLLLKASPRIEWDVIDVATKLYLQPGVADNVLAQLALNGLAVASGTPPRYRYQPQTPELAQWAEVVSEMDRTRPVTLINLVYGRPASVQAFADAFVLRPDKGK